MIERLAGRCGAAPATLGPGEKAKSPGMLYKHYSPRCRTLLFPEDGRAEAEDAFRRETAAGNRALFLCEGKLADELNARGMSALNLGYCGKEMAARLYGLLREAEKRADVLIAVEPAGTRGRDDGGAQPTEKGVRLRGYSPLTEKARKRTMEEKKIVFVCTATPAALPWRRRYCVRN